MIRRCIALLLLAVALTGCAPEAVRPPRGDQGYAFTDSTGTEVVLPGKPKRVAVLFSSYAEIWTLAGGAVSVTVGESVERGFVPAETTLVDAGAGKSIDCEALLAAEPDFVIGSADIDAQVMACETVARAGIPAALFQVDTFEDYLSMLKVCTDITGDPERYATYGTQVKAAVEAILEKAQTMEQPKKILFIRAGSRYSATKAKRAPDHFVCTMLQELGTVNIADAAPVLLDGLSLEEILLQDPDYIFLSAMGSQEAAESYIGDLFSQEGWKDLSAVKTGSYTFLPRELFHFKPNARWAEAYEILYSELSADANR